MDKSTLLRIDMPGVLSTDCVAGTFLIAWRRR